MAMFRVTCDGDVPSKSEHRFASANMVSSEVRKNALGLGMKREISSSYAIFRVKRCFIMKKTKGVIWSAEYF